MNLAAIVVLVVVGAVCCASHPLCDGPNEAYSKCGTACPETCENFGEHRACILLCVEGCFCREGFVRNATGSCVNPCDCPPKPVTTALPVPV